jgi:hypothetical protein
MSKTKKKELKTYKNGYKKGWQAATFQHAKENSEFLERRNQVHQQRIEEFENKVKKFNEEQERQRLDALRSVCQAGTVIAESMAKAFLAYEKVL